MTFLFKKMSTKLQCYLNETASLTAASKPDQLFHNCQRPKSNGNVEEKLKKMYFSLIVMKLKI